MTDREIQQACLNAYTDALENLPDNFIEAFSFLLESNMQDGVCYYANNNIDEFEYGAKWIKNEDHNEDGYWFRPPNDCENIEQIRESIQFRVDKLKEIMKDGDI